MDNHYVRIADTAHGIVEYIDTGAGRVVLCLHGAMGGYDQSWLLARTIGGPGYRYIAVSRPGYLGTPLSSGTTPEEQADLYAGLLDTLGIEKSLVFAISGGGPSAIHFALRHHDRCMGLVLASTCGGRVKNTVPFSFHVMTFLFRLPAFVNFIRKKAGSDLKKSLGRSISAPDILERTLADTEVMELYRELAVGGLHKAAQRVKGTKNDIYTTQTREYPLKDVAVPTLVIHGDKDPHVPFKEHGRRLATEIPGARLCLAEGGEHVTIFTHRNQVRDAVSTFLAEVL
jgi:pimeloyl-ACP methyl ester carboxylesterase